MRTKFKKCIREKKTILTIKNATGVKRFQYDKDYGVWVDRLFEFVKTRDLCRPDLATVPSINVSMTDVATMTSTMRIKIYIEIIHSGIQLLVPVKTAPKGENKKAITQKF